MKIEAKVEDFGLVLALNRAPAQVKKRAGKSVKAASFSVEKRVKNEMPVDYGRARASWGHWTPADLVKPGSGASQKDAHWEVKDGGLTIEQGSNVSYIQDLNQGSSTQAPLGFIDRAADAGARELTELLKDDIGRLL